MLKKIFGTVASFFGILTGLDWAWNRWDIQTPSEVWAVSLTTVFLIIYLAVNFCVYRQQILKQRIHDCAKAKGKLEKVILKKRMSSKGKRKR